MMGADALGRKTVSQPWRQAGADSGGRGNRQRRTAANGRGQRRKEAVRQWRAAVVWRMAVDDSGGKFLMCGWLLGKVFLPGICP